MSVLVVAEHNNVELKSSTLCTITAAEMIEANVDLLIVGANCQSLIEHVKKINVIKKVLVIENEEFKNPIAENISNVVLNLSEKYSYILAPASTFGKNIMPRVAALLDVAQISDIIKPWIGWIVFGMLTQTHFLQKRIVKAETKPVNFP